MTQTQALEEIFSQKKTKHTRSSTFRTWKKRYMDGELSIEKQEIVLKKFGYVKVIDAKWGKFK